MINSLKIGDLTWRHLNNPTEEDFEFLKKTANPSTSAQKSIFTTTITSSSFISPTLIVRTSL